MRTRPSATTTTSTAITRGTRISWTCCRASRAAAACRWRTWRACSGLPGKLGFDGSQVWDAYQAGDIERIRRYCETDVLNTWLIYLRFELLRGRLSPAEHAQEIELVKALLRSGKEPHYAQFLAAWETPA